MKITEALKILQAATSRPADLTYQVLLICGFTPLHLGTFLAAHLQQRLADRKVSVSTGLYGNVAGTLESLKEVQIQAVALALEWQDLDPRLGFRSAGEWGPSALADILNVARTMLDRMAAAIGNIPAGVPVACSLPTLPQPPMFHTPGWQMAEAELELERELLEFAARCSRRQGFSLVNRQRLAEESPAAARFDFKSDLATGLPYTVAHADRVGAAIAPLLAPAAAKKGLITDLDDTLWHGLVGEIGPENVTWDLASHHHLHGLYQKLLAAFSEEGVLVGIASKNDPAIAAQALGRPDMLLPMERVFSGKCTGTRNRDRWSGFCGRGISAPKAWSSWTTVPWSWPKWRRPIRESNASLFPPTTPPPAIRCCAACATFSANRGWPGKTPFAWRASGRERLFRTPRTRALRRKRSCGRRRPPSRWISTRHRATRARSSW